MTLNMRYICFSNMAKCDMQAHLRFSLQKRAPKPIPSKTVFPAIKIF